MQLIYLLIFFVCTFLLGYIVGEGRNDGKWFLFWNDHKHLLEGLRGRLENANQDS